MIAQEFTENANVNGGIDAVGIDYDNSPDYEDGPVAKRNKKEEIQWTEAKEYVLVCIYKATKAYIKGKGLKLEQKRLMAFNQLKAHGEFRADAHLLTTAGVQAKYQRLEKSIIANYALDGEGANLSGLPMNASRIEAQLYKMVEEKLQTTVRVNKKAQKNADRAERVQKIQDDMLSGMVHAPIVPAAAPTPSPTETVPSSISSGTAAPENSNKFWQTILDRREARRAEEKGASMDLSKVFFAMEERRLQIEEKRMEHELQLESRRLEIEAQKIEAEKQKAAAEIQKAAAAVQ
jgi:hypothetical protein